MRRTAGGYEIDDDPGRVDADAAVAYLTTEAYWGRWRGEHDIKGQIAAAGRVVGAYDRTGAMVGFARAFGDRGAMYLADVYVLSGHRGAGLGKALVRMMIEDGPGPGWRWMLHTSDAHGLYRQFGFARPNGRYLERPAQEEAPVQQEAQQEVQQEVQQEAQQEAQEKGPAAGTLAGKVVRLEPLRHQHVPGLVAAAADGAELYRWSLVPQDEAAIRQYVESAVAARDDGTAVPFAVVRAADDTVIGSTRFFDFDYWAWPDGTGRTGTGPTSPDTCEIGYTWLSPRAIRTGANTEMKRLMLTHAFETWRVSSVSLHTDARNQRSRDAMERIGARYEGVLRAHRLATDGKPRDSARFSVTAAEWPAVRQHLEELAAKYELGL